MLKEFHEMSYEEQEEHKATIEECAGHYNSIETANQDIEFLLSYISNLELDC
jgi:hypothetical protein